MTRSERVSAIQMAKRRFRRNGVKCCEACGWSPPPTMGSEGWRLMHAHHVLPTACGGSNDFSNFALLCPNHHAIVHARWQKNRQTGAWNGPTDRRALFAALRELDARSEAEMREKYRAERFINYGLPEFTPIPVNG